MGNWSLCASARDVYESIETKEGGLSEDKPSHWRTEDHDTSSDGRGWTSPGHPTGSARYQHPAVRQGLQPEDVHLQGGGPPAHQDHHQPGQELQPGDPPSHQHLPPQTGCRGQARTSVPGVRGLRLYHEETSLRDRPRQEPGPSAADGGSAGCLQAADRLRQHSGHQGSGQYRPRVVPGVPGGEERDCQEAEGGIASPEGSKASENCLVLNLDYILQRRNIQSDITVFLSVSENK